MRSSSASRATPATACSSPAPSSPTPRRCSATTCRPCPTSPPRSALPPALCPGCLGFQVQLRQPRHLHPRRRAGRPRRDEPGGPQDEPRGPQGERRHHRQHRRVQRPQPQARAGYTVNPLEDGSLDGYRVFQVGAQHADAAHARRRAASTARRRTAARTSSPSACATGCTTGRWRRTIDVPEAAVRKKPQLAEANIRALKAGYNFCDITELFQTRYEIPPAALEPGLYRNITGNEALALGLVAAAGAAGKPLFLGSYPITPASDILHELSTLQELRRHDLPGGRRDRRDRRGDRRRLRRRPRRHHHLAARASRSSPRR